ncbi:hypothetical protein NKH77_11270 [Streptomyces sp. M19]
MTGTDRADWQHIASAETARESGNGLGLRVRVTALPDERLADLVRDILGRLGTPRSSWICCWTSGR